MTRRIQRKRTRGWRLPEGCVCVSRPSVFGNPWRLVDPVLPGDRERIVRTFERWLRHDIYPSMSPPSTVNALRPRRARLLARLPELIGKDLACFCPESAAHCHADVLLELARDLARERQTRDDALRLGA